MVFAKQRLLIFQRSTSFSFYLLLVSTLHNVHFLFFFSFLFFFKCRHGKFEALCKSKVQIDHINSQCFFESITMFGKMDSEDDVGLKNYLPCSIMGQRPHPSLIWGAGYSRLFIVGRSFQDCCSHIFQNLTFLPHQKFITSPPFMRHINFGYHWK